MLRENVTIFSGDNESSKYANLSLEFILTIVYTIGNIGYG